MLRSFQTHSGISTTVNSRSGCYFMSFGDSNSINPDQFVFKDLSGCQVNQKVFRSSSSSWRLTAERANLSSLPPAGINGVLTSLRRWEGQRVWQASIRALVSMFNYTTITRIKPKRSIKDRAVIINAFKQTYARSLQAGGSPCYYQRGRGRTAGEKSGCEEEKRWQQEEKILWHVPKMSQSASESVITRIFHIHFWINSP